MPQDKKEQNRVYVWRKIALLVGAIAFLAIYWWIYKTWGIAIPCFWHEITGLYCPGCGITRMLESIVLGDFYQAFRYNPLCFILIPLGVVLWLNSLYTKRTGQESWVNRIPGWVWGILIVVVILYGIVRNLPYGSFLAPTQVSPL